MVFQGSMEKLTKRSHRQNINIPTWTFWVYIKGIHLWQALTVPQTEKQRFLIIIQSNGLWLQIIHSILEISKYLIV